MSDEKRAIDWAALREEYESGSKSLRQLAESYNVSKSYIIERRNKEKWNRPPTDRPANTQKVIHPDMNADRRAADAFKLRFEEHKTWDEVAAGAGYASRGAARNAVLRITQRYITHDLKEIRDEELYRINRLQARCYKDGIAEDNAAWGWAVDRFVLLSKRKSELMNLDVKPEEETTQQNYTKRIVLVPPTPLTGGESDVSNS